ncbi:hypothetical protein TNCV_2101771 [Trichonephila clavipes]|nr:hypothetical protein TNCV_2101771 [Trichonephila clavipes]
MDDNARPPRTLAVEELLESEDITRMDWPVYSLDLNPKEHVLDSLVRRIATRLHHPENTQQLKQMLIEEWAFLPQEILQKLVLNMRRRCEATIAVREDARQALGELKASIYKNFERVKSANFLEACKQNLKEAIASQVTPKRSYANVVAPSDSDNCSSEDVKKIIKAKINPPESKLGVCDLKNITGNKLLVKCFSENDRDRLLTEIQEKSPELKASVPKRRNPAIIIKNVPNEVKNEDLLKVITEQNPEIVVDDESIRQCRVRFALKTFQHTMHVVIETHPTPSKNIDSDLHKISQVFSSKNLNRLVWSMDSNSKSELWFSPYSDARGNKLSEFISANNLFIINEDCGPTFRATQGTSYIDTTVIGSDLLEDNSSWCLSKNESLSDHVMIEFKFCLSTVLRDTSSAPFVIFNTKKAKWCRFRKFCLSRMTHIFDTLNSCTNSSFLNTVIEELSFVIYQACLYSMSFKKTSKHNVPWWSIEIGCARKRLNASRRRFQRCRNPTVRELYKNNYLEYRKAYNQMLINAKSESWKKFLLTIGVQNVWKKVYTYGVKKNS